MIRSKHSSLRFRPDQSQPNQTGAPARWESGEHPDREGNAFLFFLPSQLGPALTSRPIRRLPLPFLPERPSAAVQVASALWPRPLRYQTLFTPECMFGSAWIRSLGVDQIKCFTARQSLRCLLHSSAVSLSDIYISSPAPSIHLMQRSTARRRAAATPASAVPSPRPARGRGRRVQVGADEAPKYQDWVGKAAGRGK